MKKKDNLSSNKSRPDHLDNNINGSLLSLRSSEQKQLYPGYGDNHAFYASMYL